MIDALDHLTEIVQPDQSHIKRRYNALGLLTHDTDAVGRTTEYRYADGLNQVTHRLDLFGQVIEYQYDTERNLIGLVNETGEHYQLK